MAKAQLHPALNSISGRSDGMVFRQVRGQTIVARRPRRTTRKPSAAQQAQRKRFVLAAAYAREVLSDPLQRRAYEALARERNRRADKLVAADFLNAPVVDAIDTARYRGVAGGLIRVLATDDVEVVSLHVRIETAARTLVEAGAAQRVHGVWCYTATASVPAGGPVTIAAIARDRPGNEGRGEAVYP